MSKRIALLAILTILGIAGYELWLRYAPQQTAAAQSGTPEVETYDSLEHCQVFSPKISKRIYKLIDSARSDVAIFVRHYPTGCEWGHRAEVDFPLASLNKVPIACKVLSAVDSGRLALDQLITVDYEDLRPFSFLGALIKRGQSIQLTVKELMEYMLQQSDNCAADKLIELVGGTAPIEQFMHQHGFPEITIRRSLMELFADLYQMNLPKTGEKITFSQWEAGTGTVSEADKEAGRKAIHHDLRDKGTARSLSDLLEYIFRSKMLSDKSTQTLLDMLMNCERGKERLPGLLPKGVKVAHKTGTLRGMVHDMGIIYNPSSHEYFFMTILIRNSPRSMAEDEKLSAQIAKALTESFKF